MTQPTPNEAVLHLLSTAFTSIPFNQMLGLRLDQLSPEEAAMSFTMKNELVGNFLHGILHGGVISSVLDMAGGMVVMASAVAKHPDASLETLSLVLGKCSTIDLQISYLRPGKGEHFTAKARLIKGGHQIAFTRMELFNHANVLIASAAGTYHLG